MESLIIYNNRYAQNPTVPVAQNPVAPNSFQTVAQNPMFQGMTNPSGAFNYAQNQMDPNAKKQYEGMYSNLKQQITTGLNNFPSSVAYNPNLYNWTIQLINYLVKNYDSVIIWMLEKGLTINTWVKNPTLAIAIKAAEKYPDRYQVIKNVGIKIIERLQGVRGIRNVVGFIEAGKNTKYQDLIKTLGDDAENLFKYDTSFPIDPSKIEQFLKDPKSIPPGEQKQIIEFIEKEAPIAYKTLSKSLNFEEILLTGARLGENASIYKQTAVKTFSGMAKAFPAIAEALNSVVKYLDVAVSVVDFIDWLRVINNTKWENMSRVDQTKFFLSSFKALATICYFIPGLQVIAPFINMIISIYQSYGIEAAENLGYLAGGTGFGGAAKAEAIQNIASQAVGIPPKDPQALEVYNVIFGHFKTKVKNALSKDQNKLTPEQIVKKITGGNAKEYFDNEIKTFYNALSGVGLPVIGTHRDKKFDFRWLNNTNDTRYMDLWNSLSDSVKQIISIGKTFAQNSIGEDLKNTPSYYYDVSNLPEHSAAGFGGGYKNWVSTTSGQPLIKADKAYNNRRYVTCPSI